MASRREKPGARTGPALSVVVASVESRRTIEPCLASVTESVKDLGEGSVEILLVDASRDGTVELARRSFPHVIVEEQPPGTLVPVLWARGIERARAPLIALTTGHCEVERDWARRLIEALNDGVAGAGGPLALRPGAGVVDWAVYFLRYSGFLPDRERGRHDRPSLGEMDVRPVREIPADNALYRADDLRRHAGLFHDGFWEVPFHRELRAQGRGLVWVPGARVGFGLSWPFFTILAHRFAHGSHFGRWRIREGRESKVRVIAAAPLVPLVLALRTGRRLADRPALLFRFAASLPWFLLLAGSWALGEAAGAWRAA